MSIYDRQLHRVVCTVDIGSIIDAVQESNWGNSAIVELCVAILEANGDMEAAERLRHRLDEIIESGIL